MRNTRLNGALLLALGAAVFRGCAEESAPTTPMRPAFNFSNGPANAGPFIVRFQGPFPGGSARFLSGLMQPGIG